MKKEILIISILAIVGIVIISIVKYATRPIVPIKSSLTEIIETPKPLKTFEIEIYDSNFDNILDTIKIDIQKYDEIDWKSKSNISKYFSAEIRNQVIENDYLPDYYQIFKLTPNSLNSVFFGTSNKLEAQMFPLPIIQRPLIEFKIYNQNNELLDIINIKNTLSQSDRKNKDAVGQYMGSQILAEIKTKGYAIDTEFYLDSQFSIEDLIIKPPNPDEPLKIIFIKNIQKKTESIKKEKHFEEKDIDKSTKIFEKFQQKKPKTNKLRSSDSFDIEIYQEYNPNINPKVGEITLTNFKLSPYTKWKSEFDVQIIFSPAIKKEALKQGLIPNDRDYIIELDPSSIVDFEFDKEKKTLEATMRPSAIIEQDIPKFFVYDINDNLVQELNIKNEKLKKRIKKSEMENAEYLKNKIKSEIKKPNYEYEIDFGRFYSDTTDISGKPKPINIKLVPIIPKEMRIEVYYDINPQNGEPKKYIYNINPKKQDLRELVREQFKKEKIRTDLTGEYDIFLVNKKDNTYKKLEFDTDYTVIKQHLSSPNDTYFATKYYLYTIKPRIYKLEQWEKEHFATLEKNRREAEEDVRLFKKHFANIFWSMDFGGMSAEEAIRNMFSAFDKLYGTAEFQTLKEKLKSMKNNKHRDSKGYYSILKISHTATLKEIKKAFKNIIRKHHSDRVGGDDEITKKIIEAYEILKDPERKARYDYQEMR